MVDCRLDVGLEETRVDLAEDVADGFRLFGKLDGEGGLELRDQLRNDLGTEVGDVRECEKHADVLQMLAQV